MQQATAISFKQACPMGAIVAETHNELVIRLAAALAGLHSIESGAARLCEASRRMLGADGVALTMRTSTQSMVVLATTDDLASQLEDLQDVVGEGPSRDAYRLNTVQTGEFAAAGDVRWPLMREHGQRLGFSGSIVALPLRPHQEAIGTLTAYRAQPPFPVDTVTTEFLAAAIGTAILQDPRLDTQSEVFAEVWPSRAQIHQATGMIISQVGVRPEDALALLRGQAFANNTTLLDTAQQIVERRINFRHFTIEGD